MRKTGSTFILKIIFGFVFLVLLMLGSSCKSKKESISKSVQVSNTEKVRELEITDSVQESQEIVERLTIPVPKSNTGDADLDKKVDKAVDEVLAKISSEKKSGSNSSKAKYDARERQVIIDTKVGATQQRRTVQRENDSTATDSSQSTDNSSEETRTRWPWWLWLALIGGSVVFLLQLALRLRP